MIPFEIKFMLGMMVGTWAIAIFFAAAIIAPMLLVDVLISALT